MILFSVISIMWSVIGGQLNNNVVFCEILFLLTVLKNKDRSAFNLNFVSFSVIGLEFWRPPCNRPPHQTTMGHLSFTLTVALTMVSLLLIIFSGKRTHVSGSLKIKTHEGVIYQYERKVMCEYTPWRLDSLLYSACVKKRKRSLADENILQSPEKARSFLGKSTRGYRTNYALFWEECCLEGCNTEEILEHCVVAYK